MPLEITATEAEGFDLHPEDEWIDATIQDIEEDEGEYGPSLRWVFDVDGDEVWAWCSQKLSKRSKLGGWLKGLGHDIEAGETVNLKEYIGNPVQIMFERYDGFYDGEPIEKEKIVKVRKGKGKAQTGSQAKAKMEAELSKEDLEAPF